MSAQEADSRKISCRPERRAEFKEELQDAIPDATSLLTRYEEARLSTA
jgi:hypothetical protein